MSEQQITEAEEKAGLVGGNKDFLEEEFKEACEEIIPHPHEIPIQHFKTAYMHLRSNLKERFDNV